MWLAWFRIDCEWAARRDALLRAEEDAIIAAARDRTTGPERLLLDELLAERARNASRMTHGSDRSASAPSPLSAGRCSASGPPRGNREGRG